MKCQLLLVVSPRLVSRKLAEITKRWLITFCLFVCSTSTGGISPAFKSRHDSAPHKRGQVKICWIRSECWCPSAPKSTLAPRMRNHSLFYFTFLSISFLERGEGRGKEREKKMDVREKHWSADFCPCRRPNPQSRHVPWPEIEPATFHFAGRCPTNWATPVRDPVSFQIHSTWHHPCHMAGTW